MACTIGGNVAENSGGPHCLKYGMTVNHVLAIEVVDSLEAERDKVIQYTSDLTLKGQPAWMEVLDPAP